MYVNVIDYVEISGRLRIKLAHFFKLKANQLAKKQKQKNTQKKQKKRQKNHGAKKPFFYNTTYNYNLEKTRVTSDCLSSYDEVVL